MIKITGWDRPISHVNVGLCGGFVALHYNCYSGQISTGAVCRCMLGGSPKGRWVSLHCHR